MSKRTITLTDRPPVTIDDDAWPQLATASYHDYEGQYDFQSFRHWKGHVTVRQHEDGRAIVYARCWYDTAHLDENGYDQRAGKLLSKDASVNDIVQAIKDVHSAIDIVDDDHRDMWRVLADECIADLPAEELT